MPELPVSDTLDAVYTVWGGTGKKQKENRTDYNKCKHITVYLNELKQGGDLPSAFGICVAEELRV